jgi:flagellar FliL protein
MPASRRLSDQTEKSVSKDSAILVNEREKTMAEKKTEEKTDEKKGGMIKIILIAVGVIVLLAGVGVGAYLLGANGTSKETPEGAADKVPRETVVLPVGPMVAMDDFIVNILDAEGTRYLKASMTLELASPEALNEVEERKAQVRDAILLYLSSKTFDEIRDLQGKLQLRADLIGKINGLLSAGKVKTIYFTDFVVQ